MRILFAPMHANTPHAVDGPRRGGKPLQPGGATRFNLTLDDDTADGMRSLGEGNLSAGIRKAWGIIKKLASTQ